jgi:hypothetical protein
MTASAGCASTSSSLTRRPRCQHPRVKTVDGVDGVDGRCPSAPRFAADLLRAPQPGGSQPRSNARTERQRPVRTDDADVLGPTAENRTLRRVRLAIGAVGLPVSNRARRGRSSLGIRRTYTSRRRGASRRPSRWRINAANSAKSDPARHGPIARCQVHLRSTVLLDTRSVSTPTLGGSRLRSTVLSLGRSACCDVMYRRVMRLHR